MEGKGDVRRMKCSHTKNVASLFPLTCVDVCGELPHVVKQDFAKEDELFTCLGWCICYSCASLYKQLLPLFKDWFGQKANSSAAVFPTGCSLCW